MNMVDCPTLGLLIQNHEPLELIDIRPRTEFSAMHIPGARSLPFAELAKPRRILKWRRKVEPIYIVSDDRVKASLAAGILRSNGYLNATVVDGGMKQWRAQGLPVLTKSLSFRPNFLRTGSTVAGIVALVALGLMKILVGALVMMSALALFTKARLIQRSQALETPKLDWAAA
jgi:rhodanese-related sulfurtransferase